MVANVMVDTTGTKDVPLKSAGNEKVKVSVCLTAKADGTKLKPFIVLQDAKCEAAALKEELNAEYLNSNPSEITESDTEEANTNNNLIDPSDSDDDLIDIEL